MYQYEPVIWSTIRADCSPFTLIMVLTNGDIQVLMTITMWHSHFIRRPPKYYEIMLIIVNYD